MSRHHSKRHYEQRILVEEIPAACPVCKGNQSRVYRTHPQRLNDIDYTYRYRSCKCGNRYVSRAQVKRPA